MLSNDPKASRNWFAILAGSALIAVVIGWICFNGQDQSANQRPGASQSQADRYEPSPVGSPLAFESSTGPESASEAFFAGITQNHFRDSTRKKLWEMHSRFFEPIFDRDNRKIFLEAVEELRSLPDDESLDSLLHDHPEALTTCLMLGLRAKELSRLKTKGNHPSDLEFFLSLFLLQETSLQCNQLLSVLMEYGEPIVTLYDRGFLGAELLFREAIDGSPDPFSVWLNQETLSLVQSGDEDTISGVYLFFWAYGPEFRALFRDPSLRGSFEANWGYLKHLDRTGKMPLECLIFNSELFDLLNEKRGKQLLEKSGTLVLELRKVYSESLRDFMEGELLHGSPEAMKAFVEFRNNTDFRGLINRPVFQQSQGRFAAYQKLVNQDWKPDYLFQLSDSALLKELEPKPAGFVGWIPGYSVIDLMGKFIEGRKPDERDYFEAVVDIVTLPIPGSGPIRASGKATTKELGKQALRSKVTDEASKKAVDNLSQRVLQQSGARELLKKNSLEFARTFKKSSKAFESLPNKIDRALSFEITDLVRFLYRKTNGKATKAITGVDARIFMRSDRVVRVHYGPLIRDILIDQFTDPDKPIHQEIRNEFRRHFLFPILDRLIKVLLSELKKSDSAIMYEDSKSNQLQASFRLLCYFLDK